jgi:hypothetical protein
MWAAPPDPGALTVTRYRHRGGLLRFANIFAANDPESTLLNNAMHHRLGLIRRPTYAVINCRRDRLERNAQMGALIPALDVGTVFLIGQVTRSARREIPATFNGEVVDLGDAVEVAQPILDRVTCDASLVAIGNIHGAGTRLMHQLDQTCTVEPAYTLSQEAAA